MTRINDAARRSELPLAISTSGSAFSYAEAFSRNLGWVTEWEQLALRGKRVAIAGMGGVGGVHLLTLARFGIGAFRIADPDWFESANFNRQVGATLSSIGRSKVDVLAEQALGINPELRIDRLHAGLDELNLDEFLIGADLCIDGLDFFAFDIREKMTNRCGELGIPVVNAAPLGMGTAFLIFLPGGMRFEEWFRLAGQSEEGKAVSYLLGMAPSALHRSYLADPSRVDLRRGRGPSTVAACELCAGVAAVAAIKLLLGRGRVRPVPYYHQFDAYRGRYITKKLRGGNAHPLQRLKIALTRRLAARLSRQADALATSTRPPSESAPLPYELEQILELARWAPSGDNVQPWRFEFLGEDALVVHLVHPTDHAIYEYRDGEPTLLAAGMLLESMRIAASAYGRCLEWRYEGRKENIHRIHVNLPKIGGLTADALIADIPMRSVDRRWYRRRRLTEKEKGELAKCLGSAVELEWHEAPERRWRLARLGGMAMKVRLSAPEAFVIHQRILDWDHDRSPNSIPAAAAGLSTLSRGLMRWAMRSWGRTRLLNRLGGMAVAALELDYLPGLFSAAFFTIRVKDRGDTASVQALALIRAGQAIQKFWLTATHLGLAVQPTMATLIFAHNGRHQPSFTRDEGARQRAAKLARGLDEVLGDISDVVFTGRIGAPPARGKFVRSVRLPLRDLMT